MSRRKAEMVLTLVDKATRPVRRFIALQKRMGGASERANRVSARSSRTAKRATDLYTGAVRRLDRAQDVLRSGIRRANQVIATQAARLRSSGAMMRSGIMGVGRAAVLAGGLFTVYSGTVSAAGAAMLGPARQFERFQTVLTTTEGSAQAAKEAMGWVQNFAVRTPYELDQVMASFVQLRAYGLDPTNGMLKTLGDASAAMNKPLMQSVEAMADAVTGENERLKELGIKAAKVGKYFEYSYTGKDGTDKIVRALASDRQAIQSAILGIFTEKYDGAMNLLSLTFDGMTSNLADQWNKFQLMIMDAGVFDWMKSKLKFVLDEINRLEASGELQIWAKRIADHIIVGLEAIWSFGSSAIEFWQTLYPVMQSAADALGGWRNLALAVVAIPLRGFIIGAAVGLVQFAGGALLAARYLTGIGFTAAAGGALRLGSVMLAILNPMRLVRFAVLALRGAFMTLRWSVILTFSSLLLLGKGLLLALNPLNWVRGAVVLLKVALLATLRGAKAFGLALLSLRAPTNLLKVAFVALRFAIISTGVGALVVGLAMAGTWIYNNWSGLVAFFKGFGEAFMASLGPARPLVQGIVDGAALLWDWMTKLVGPVNAGAETWRQWGVNAGEAVGTIVSGILNLPSHLSDLNDHLYDKGVAFMQSIWDGMASILETMVAAIAAKLSGIVPDWMKSAWEWAQGSEAGQRDRVAQLAARAAPGGHQGGPFGISAQRRVTAAARVAAVTSAVAVGGPLAAETPVADGSRYVTARAAGNTTISAPVTIKVEGNVDRDVMPDLEDLAERTADKVEERIRESQRRGHD